MGSEDDAGGRRRSGLIVRLRWYEAGGRKRPLWGAEESTRSGGGLALGPDIVGFRWQGGLQGEEGAHRSLAAGEGKMNSSDCPDLFLFPM